MSKNSRAIFLFLTIVAVLLVSAVGTTSVYADDGAPPPPDSGEVIPPVDGEVPPTGGEEPAATEPAEVVPPAGEGEPAVTEPLDEAAAPTEAPVVEEQPPAEPEAEAASILEQVPDDTTVTVLNPGGEAQPLTTQESADAILTSDPIWCPQFVAPIPGVGGCTDVKADFTELLSFLQANEGNPAYQQAGTIFVQMGAYTGTESSIDFNAYNFQNLDNYNLTVQGGWDTTDNSTDPTDTTQFTIPIVVGTSTNPWVGSLTFNNLSISDVYNQTGLTLFSQGNISLSNVEVTNSQGGADLHAGRNVIINKSKFNDNKQFGARVNAGRFVSIANSEFNNNTSSKYDGFGLEVNAQNDVYLDTVSASFNEQFGANLSSATYVSVYDSVFSGNVSYTYTSCGHKKATGGYGLQIVGTSPVYLEGVTANDNYLFGAHLEGSEVEVYSSTFNHNGSGSMSDPKGYGLQVVSGSFVTLGSVHADNNQLFGADVQAQGEVTITDSFFDGNKSYKCSCNGTSYYGYGLQVVTSGDVVLARVSASGNNLVGAHLKGADVIVVGNLLDHTHSLFNNNGSGNQTLTGKGLEIESTGEVTLRLVEANNNQLFGANIQSAGNVAIQESFFNGTKHTYSSSCKGSVTTGGYGLQVVTTDGAIALSMVQASDNYLYGARLESHESGDLLFGVSVGGDAGQGIYSLFNNNQSGLEIKSDGPVALNLVEANGNKLFGADVSAAGDVAVANSFFNGNQSYTSSSCKGKTYNGYGLRVVTTSAVAVANVAADNNYVFGASLTGTNVAVSASSFSSNGTDVLSDHIGKGLEVVSTGSESVVTLSGVIASDNQLFGANVKADGLVFVDHSVFNGNKSYTSTCYCKTYDGYGLKVVTSSDVRLEAVTANGNYLFGARLEGANVTVLNSLFNENASPLQKDKAPTGRGLEVKSTGDTLLQGVTANDNQLFGATVEAGGKVDVIASIFARNKYYTYSSCHGTKSAGYGLKVVTTDPTLGTILLDNVTAVDNGAEGAILQSPATVQVTAGSFSTNGATGLSITASGNVTLINVTADGNQVDGVDVTGICTNTIIVHDGTFSDNSKWGIKIVNATYSPEGAPFFGGNGSGNVFESGCVTSSASNSSENQNTSAYSGGHSYSHHWHSHHWYGHHHR